MIAIIILCILLSVGIWLSQSLGSFMRAEEIIKHEQWEEEKMIYP